MQAQKTIEYDRQLEASNHETRELLTQRIDDRIEQTLKEHRRDLTRFLDSLRTRSSVRQDQDGENTMRFLAMRRGRKEDGRRERDRSSGVG